MKACGNFFKYRSILLMACAHLALADVNNIPHSQEICATVPQTLPGVDVSVFQSKADWTTVGNAGNGFVFVKATQGISLPNTAFALEWPAAGTAGFLRSAYHYFVPTDDPIQQANFFLNTIGTLAATDLPPMFDWEITNGMAVSAVIAGAQKWLDYVEQQTGRIPIIYTSASFFNQLGNPTGFDRYPLYVSDYVLSYPADCPKVPQPWTSWTFWQYSQTGNVTGIPGHTDLDVFNGVFNDLATFITGDVPASPSSTD
jgi:lysozyme